MPFLPSCCSTTASYCKPWGYLPKFQSKLKYTQKEIVGDNMAFPSLTCAVNTLEGSCDMSTSNPQTIESIYMYIFCIITCTSAPKTGNIHTL